MRMRRCKLCALCVRRRSIFHCIHHWDATRATASCESNHAALSAIQQHGDDDDDDDDDEDDDDEDGEDGEGDRNLSSAR